MNILEKFLKRNKKQEPKQGANQEVLKELETLRAKVKEYEQTFQDIDKNFMEWYKQEQENQEPSPEPEAIVPIANLIKGEKE